MELVAVVIGLALLEYFVFGALVGRARVQYKVDAPAIAGHPVFERYFRVQQNTLELLVMFVPATWLFGTFVSTNWAAILGAVYLVGRIVYLRTYVADPARRSAGFGLSILPILVMILGVLWSAGTKLL
jgi:uncharacterized membrane protein YecN with MAPEG domain